MKYIIISLLAAVVLISFYSCKNNNNQSNEPVTESSMQSPEIPLLPPHEFVKTVKADSSAVIIDVRKPEEFNAGHLQGAKLLNVLEPDSFNAGIKELDKEKRYYIYCRSGKRSHDAALKMQEAGLSVIEMDGGMLAFEESYIPLVNATDKEQ